MDIDKLTPILLPRQTISCFSTLLDIDKLTLAVNRPYTNSGFSTLLDIDKLTLIMIVEELFPVLVLCWILINLHR